MLRLLSSVLKRIFLKVHATYRLNWHRFPVVVVVLLHQVKSFLQVLHLTIISHKDTWEEIYSFVHSLGVHLKFRSKVFSSCPDCRYSDRLVCLNHTIREVQAKKTIEKIDKSFAKLLLNDFDNFHYSVNDYTFKPIIAKLESKYCKNNKEWIKGWFNSSFTWIVFSVLLRF